MRRQCEYQKVYDPFSGRYVIDPIFDEPMNRDEEWIIDGKPESVFIEECRELLKKCNEEIEPDYDEYEAESDYDEYDVESDDGEEMEPDNEELDMCFKPDEIKLLRKMNLPSPSTISDADRDVWFVRANDLLNRIGRMKGAYVKNGDADKINFIDNLMVLIRIYKDILKPNEDKTGGRYKQNRRNAYKIGSGGRYGNLVIHLPSLIKDSVLIAYKNGRKIYGKKVDQDTIDLLTKRFNSKKQYSDLSKMIFNELNQLSEIPIHRSSMKYSKLGARIDVENLIDRFEVLIDKIDDGKMTEGIKKEYLEIVKKLYQAGEIEHHTFEKALDKIK